MNKIDLTKARIYVCLKKEYPQKLSQGHWFDMIHYLDLAEFECACHRLVENKEVMYFDYEHIPDVYVTESWICAELFPLIRTVSDLPVNEQGAFSCWLDLQRPDLSEVKTEKLIGTFRFCYEGTFKNKRLFGRFYAKEQLAITPENSPHFDFSGYTHFLFNGMFLFEDGYVFKNSKQDQAIDPHY